MLNHSNQRTKAIIVIIFILLICHKGYAQENKNSLANLDRNPAKGWYFYEKKVQPQELVFSLFPLQGQTKQTDNKKNTCPDPLKWTVDCGFINPTTLGLSSEQAFKFEQKQYKSLLRNYSLYPNDVDAVYRFQKFNMWVLNQAMTASYTWQYNLAQHPDVDANVQVPVSQLERE